MTAQRYSAQRERKRERKRKRDRCATRSLASRRGSA
jgi:hypothetical protein